jgi:succinyl-diaminopimelate desuccinylase
MCEEAGHAFKGKVHLRTAISGEAFYTAPGSFVDVVAGAVRAATGAEPELSTSGGTSDARFIRALCPVVEFGLVGTTMHRVDEAAPVAEIRALADAYEAIITRYFKAFG